MKITIPWGIRSENYNSVENCQRKELQFCEELSTLRITILWRIVNVKNYNSVENCQRENYNSVENCQC